MRSSAEVQREISSVMAIQEGPVAYIAACGWSRQVWLWSDLPADTEGRARVPCLRCFHGHEDDVLCASFAAPNVLATG